jgi:uncharacterized protein YkwD
MEAVMGPRRSLNAALRHAHVCPLARTFAASPAAKRLSVCIALVLFAVLAVTTAAPAEAITMTKAERQVLALVNHVRATHGLHKLTMVQSLERAARAHSREMVSRDYFGHISFSGESFGARLVRFGYSQAGYTRWTVGEDIAYGSGSRGTPQAIFNAWMHSAAHRAVILTARFRNAGVGRAKGTFRGISGIVFFTLDCGARTR